MRRMLLLVVVLVVISISSAPVESAAAGWVLNGTALCTAPADQVAPAMVSDGGGGAIVAWADKRSTQFPLGSYDIYVQRVNASGVPQWTVDGLALCTAVADQGNVSIVSDGAGGAIVTWVDYRNVLTGGDIYVRRVSASGVPMWTANGVSLCQSTGDQLLPQIISDGAGGAIVTWEDGRSTPNTDIYAQRVNASGAVQWTPGGVPVATPGNNQYHPTIAPDGSGGAIVTWYDDRSGTNSDIYAQRVNASGATQWTTNGVALCTVATNDFDPMIVSDSAGGAIVTWYQNAAANLTVFAQRVSSSGTPQWAANGVVVCDVGDIQVEPKIVSDGVGGAIIAWRAIRNNPNYDVYAQRVSASGALQWPADGVALCTVAAKEEAVRVVSDGDGGAIITWEDFRNLLTGPDIYAQAVRASGTTRWTTDGVALCTTSNSQQFSGIIADGAGNAIVAWQDERSGTPDIYAQRVEGRYGQWGTPEPEIVSVSDEPVDQGGTVVLNWDASGLDVLNQQLISYYSIWRAVTFVPSGSSEKGEPVFRGSVLTSRADVGRDFEGSAIYREETAAGTYYWEWVANQAARYSAGYSYLVPTRQDSVAGNPATHYFQVLAHTADPYTFWESNVMTGHSVDNIAPVAPLSLTALRVGADVHLKWNPVSVSDLKNYSVYRGMSTGVTPVPGHFIASANDTVLVDVGAPGSVLYYIVTASDIHGNQSAPSNEASVGSTWTGVGDTPALTVLSVRQNYPNPFTGTTELEIGMPHRGDIHVDVYDVAGRRIDTIDVKGAAAGWDEVEFSGRDTAGHVLPSGVYFYRVSANGETLTRKMVIAR